MKLLQKEIYGADGVTYSPAAERELKRITDLGMEISLYVWQRHSIRFLMMQKKLGRPSGFKINVREFMRQQVQALL